MGFADYSSANSIKNTSVKVLLDIQVLTNANRALQTRKGKNKSIGDTKDLDRHTFSRTLFYKDQRSKQENTKDWQKQKITGSSFPPGCLTHSDVSQVPKCFVLSHERPASFISISHFLWRGRGGDEGVRCAWWGVLHFGCGGFSLVHDEQPSFLPKNSFFLCAALLFLSLVHAVVFWISKTKKKLQLELLAHKIYEKKNEWICKCENKHLDPPGNECLHNVCICLCVIGHVCLFMHVCCCTVDAVISVTVF